MPLEEEEEEEYSSELKKKIDYLILLIDIPTIFYSICISKI